MKLSRCTAFGPGEFDAVRTVFLNVTSGDGGRDSKNDRAVHGHVHRKSCNNNAEVFTRPICSEILQFFAGKAVSQWISSPYIPAESAGVEPLQSTLSE